MDKQNITKTSKADLKQLVNDVVSGSHRVPALFFNDPFATFLGMNLENYEILPVEPLHTIAGHIKNVYQEVQEQFGREKKKAFQTIISASFSGKEAKRGADYRLSLVQCTQALQEQNVLTKNLAKLFTTLAEIQSILYLGEYERSSIKILRLYNLTFLHAIAMKKMEISKISRRKLFGQYYHALISNAPQQYRIVSLSSANAEDEERQFNFLKTISSSTSNHHPENVLANAFVRLQVNNKLKNERPQGVSNIEARISKAFKDVKQ